MHKIAIESDITQGKWEKCKHTREGRKRKGKPYKRKWDIPGKKAARDIRERKGNGKDARNAREGKKGRKKEG